MSHPRRKPLRILHVPGQSGWGGGEKYVLTLLRNLPGEKFSFEVLVPVKGPFIDELGALGVPVHFIDFSRLLNPISLYRFYRFLKGNKFDVVQSHGARMNFYTRVAARLARAPFVVSTIHASLDAYPVSSLRKGLYKLLDGWTSSWAHVNLFVAEALASKAKEEGFYPLETVSIVPNGVDLDRLNPEKVKGEKIRRDLQFRSRPVVLAGGRLAEEKDHAAFLRAIALVKREVPDVLAVVAGDGPLRAELEKLAQDLDLHENCLFLGARPDVPEILRAANVFVLSSFTEGMPFMVLEAMALETPVVATAVGDVPRLLRNEMEGLLVQPRSPEQLSAAITRSLKNKDQARSWAQAGRRRVAKLFSISEMLKGWQDACVNRPLKRKILLLNAAGWGDFIESVPVLEALRRDLPRDILTLVVSEKYLEYARSCPYVDDVLALPSSHAHVSAAASLGKFLETTWILRRRSYQVAANFKELGSPEGAWRLKWWLKILKIPEIIGRDTRGWGTFYTRKLPETASEVKPFLDSFTEVGRALGMRSEPLLQPGRLWVSEDSLRRGNELLSSLKGKKLVGFHPGGDRPTRRWLPERFAQAADQWASQGFGIVLFGSASEKSLTRQVRESMKVRSGLDLAGRTSAEELVGIIRKLSLLVTNDTSALHIAAAEGVPVVAIIASADPKSSWPRHAKGTFFRKPWPCSPCFYYECPMTPYKGCMTQVSVQEVLEAGRALL